MRWKEGPWSSLIYKELLKGRWDPNEPQIEMVRAEFKTK